MSAIDEKRAAHGVEPTDTRHSPDGIDSKPEAVQSEGGSSKGSVDAAAVEFTEEDENRVIRKLDWHIMPIIFVLYSFSVLDRSNLGNARLAGLPNDIDLTGRRYDWLGTIFYISCAL